MGPPRYASPEAFRQALEHRIRASAGAPAAWVGSARSSSSTASSRAFSSTLATEPSPRAVSSWSSVSRERAPRAMSTCVDLPWRTLPELLDAVRAFLDPVLWDERGSWDPGTWSW